MFLGWMGLEEGDAEMGTKFIKEKKVTFKGPSLSLLALFSLWRRGHLPADSRCYWRLEACLLFHLK